MCHIAAAGTVGIPDVMGRAQAYHLCTQRRFSKESSNNEERHCHKRGRQPANAPVRRCLTCTVFAIMRTNLSEQTTHEALQLSITLLTTRNTELSTTRPSSNCTTCCCRSARLLALHSHDMRRSSKTVALACLAGST